ncbi:MAG: bifunctional methylenetetrahydrofolate dehydrogenase/methenyltetrahydrofolate cyclohydrolase FolD [Gammaproteobacteria bacterium]|nr:MAG: bifunctional methylenetetrahydrofolate dehydrogenase/methenyltetrahydrofolate cyclohydrolase FolD [Gammaproteobacteria bacterium]RLA59129.1 MAG: bifunctional methylenetetrahydrofolate dehydrogenase/methenyltetrahydrofolate cyclohydrolase FolD [Gammaproteobacteria bacterium]
MVSVNAKIVILLPFTRSGSSTWVSSRGTMHGFSGTGSTDPAGNLFRGFHRMAALILDGKSLAAQTEAELLARVEKLKERSGGKTPILATILVGDDPASATYVKMKGNACRRVGMESMAVEMPSATTTGELLARIEELNNNPDVHGILLQHPVPAQIDERLCFDSIALSKDVDGVTCLGFGRMAMGEEAYGCATPQGIMRILEHYNIDIEGKHAVVVGRSPILGKPMAMMLLQKHATVTICHSRTKDLSGIVAQADILVGAVGKPEFIRADWVKDGAVVIDAGYHPGGIGDIELSALVDKVAAYTPVPGGVGPMTINTLIMQSVESGEKSLG